MDGRKDGRSGGEAQGRVRVKVCLGGMLHEQYLKPLPLSPHTMPIISLLRILVPVRMISYKFDEKSKNVMEECSWWRYDNIYYNVLKEMMWEDILLVKWWESPSWSRRWDEYDDVGGKDTSRTKDIHKHTEVKLMSDHYHTYCLIRVASHQGNALHLPCLCVWVELGVMYCLSRVGVVWRRGRVYGQGG